MNGFLSIAITPPEDFAGEAGRISDLLESGEADYVHIRKPFWDINKTRELIRAIPDHLHPKLRIHDHFSLTDEFSLGGVHLNSRNPLPPLKEVSVTRSCHGIEQLTGSEHYFYETLSPIFDSISKKGYRSRFNLREISPSLRGKRVVALGGVTPDRFPELKNAGFIGAAMLGYFFNQNI